MFVQQAFNPGTNASIDVMGTRSHSSLWQGIFASLMKWRHHGSCLTSILNSARLCELMSRWNIQTSARWILGSVFVLMLIIVILPDVDLPDTAFHRGTEPVVVHSQATAAPTSVPVALAFHVSRGLENNGRANRPSEFQTSFWANFRPILFRSIRC